MNVFKVFFVLSGLTYLFRDLYFHKCCYLNFVTELYNWVLI
uniref:Uncharacterized protein n=1 Tax=Anguilla anguilla TaxID=7936 RepID=A0A0E9TYV8_ANGAN